VVDLQGRVVRRLPPAIPNGAPAGQLAQVRFDARDQQGGRLGSGRYWVRASQPGGWAVRGGFVLIR